MDTKVSIFPPVRPGCGLNSKKVGQVTGTEAGGLLHVEPRNLGGPVTVLDSAESHLDYIGDYQTAENWLELQLLDCQNLARLHGLTDLASVLDGALELLAPSVSLGLDARAGTSVNDLPDGSVLPFRARNGH